MKRKQLLLFSLILLCFSVSSRAQTDPIDPARKIPWNPGIPGGIPERTTICATLSPGATGAQINSAIANCPAGQVVFLNAGTYNISGEIIFNDKSNVTLRGAGPTQTILNFVSGGGCIGISADICIRNGHVVHSQSPGNLADWTAGYAKGTTVITLSSTTNLQVGTLLILDQINDDVDGVDNGELFICQEQNLCSQEGGATGRPANGTYRSQIHIVEVVAINGNDITISPSLHMSNWRAARIPQAWWSNDTPVTGIGIEDLTLDHANSSSQSGIFFNQALKCWVKNVKSLNGTRNHIWLSTSRANVIRDSYFYGAKSAASQSYAVETDATSDNLIENNIIERVTGAIVLGGASTGNVFAYNYANDMVYFVANFMIGAFIHHNPGISMTLFEGNDGNQFQADLVHGTSHFATVFRNRYNGWEPGKTKQTSAILIYAKNRYMNIVGNVLGESSYHNNYESLPGQGIEGNTAVFRVGQGATTLPNDTLTVTSLLRWGNYDTVTDTVRFESSEVPSGISPYGNPVPANQSILNSYYLSARPSFFDTAFGNVPWPPIGPDVTNGDLPNVGGHAYKIPARLCYENTSLSGDGATKAFDARNCYGNTSPRPAPPTNLGVVVR